MCLGVPGKITTIDDGFMRMGTVDVDGSRLEVCLAYTPEAEVGDYVLIHAGFALSRLDEQQALQTLETLRGLTLESFGKENPHEAS